MGKDYAYGKEDKTLSTSVELLKAVNHPFRVKLIQFIHEQGTVNVGTIYKALGGVQAETSFQLGILRRAKLILSERRNKFVFYSINYEKFKAIQDAITKFEQI